MTTKDSPLDALQVQADKIAATLKAAERGELVDGRFQGKIEAARGKENFKIGIVMDDKVIAVEIPWATIRSTPESGIAEYIVRQMRETTALDD